MNWIPKNLKELGQLADKLKAEKHPDFPPHALVKKRFKDTTANDLTKTIIWDMYHVREGVAYRINNGAVYDVKKRVYRAGVQRKGVPISSESLTDVSSALKSRLVPTDNRRTKRKLKKKSKQLVACTSSPNHTTITSQRLRRYDSRFPQIWCVDRIKVCR